MSAAPDLWFQALDAEICEGIDALTDHLAADAMGVTLPTHQIQGLAAKLALGMPAIGTPKITPAEFLAVMLTTQDPAAMMSAQKHLREWYLAARSSEVAARVWSAQDAAERPAELDAMDAYKAHRDRDLDVGCEFDRGA